jgi:lysozyme family protein
VTRFRPCVDFVIDRLEGGGRLVTDQGGLTRWGISRKAHPNVDIANLTRDGACSIYLSDYWGPNNCALLPAGLDLLVFAAVVNTSALKVIRLLQGVLRVPEDGIMGARTLGKAKHHLFQQDLRAAFAEVLLQRYERIAREDPATHGSSLHGWRLRVLRTLDEAGRQA